MKVNFMLLVLSALFIVSCANSNRTPSSIEEKKDTAHEQYEGYFDRPVQ
jgi:PBP1b-binding outer membrane lipoprotein LpoB